MLQTLKSGSFTVAHTHNESPAQFTAFGCVTNWLRQGNAAVSVFFILNLQLPEVNKYCLACNICCMSYADMPLLLT